MARPLDEDAPDAEAAFSELMGKLFELRATHVICSSTLATFKQGLVELEELPLLEGMYDLLRAHGQKLAGLGPNEEKGSAILYAGGRALRLLVFAGAGDITFAVEDGR